MTLCIHFRENWTMTKQRCHAVNCCRGDTEACRSAVAILSPAQRSDGKASKISQRHLFVASRPKYPEQLEMPPPILSLAGTAIFAGHSEYQNNGTRQVLKFTEGAYENTYRYHCKTLADSRAAAPTTTAKLLHAIYADVTNFSAKSVGAHATTLMKLVEVPDFD
ncbi:hypothetical protein C8J57DRAFT_1241300 [Mycena rebaudengoi]|nr:hypothetical protein C8J57DRAFT_1241300 [Mycena rebaudengoi]